MHTESHIPFHRIRGWVLDITVITLYLLATVFYPVQWLINISYWVTAFYAFSGIVHWMRGDYKPADHIIYDFIIRLIIILICTAAGWWWSSIGWTLNWIGHLVTRERYELKSRFK